MKNHVKLSICIFPITGNFQKIQINISVYNLPSRKNSAKVRLPVLLGVGIRKSWH